MKIAIVGAGPSGLATAAVLQQFGHDVIVFEKAPDLGGVWSASRAYPGVATQDDRVTYAFSDVPMPADFPEHPSGGHVRAYLEHYADVKGVRHRVHLGVRVVSAELREEADGWVVGVLGPDGPASHEVDWLVMANGVFSTPHVPDWPGRAEFEAHGGRVVEPTSLGAAPDLAGRRVTVIGWGKTACDVAVQSSRTAQSTTVVARTIRWKLPKRTPIGLNFRHLVLTRLGERLLAPPGASFPSRLVAAVGRTVMWFVARYIARHTGARATGMVPSLTLPHSDSIVSEGFFEAIAEGRIRVHRERGVDRLGAVDGVPGVRLTDGTWVPADRVVPATGFEQDVSFLGSSVRAALVDGDEVLRLHRRILPLDVPRLAFAGWGHTYRSPLTAEVGAVWLAAHLAGALELGTREQRRSAADRYHLTHVQSSAAAEAQVPTGSFPALDLLLQDLGMPLPAAVRRQQWFRPLDPAQYAHLVHELRWWLGLVGDEVSERVAVQA